MVRRDGCKLFQMSGPHTANSRRLKSVRVGRIMAALVDVEHRGRRCGSDEVGNGHGWAVTWCTATRMTYIRPAISSIC